MSKNHVTPTRAQRRGGEASREKARTSRDDGGFIVGSEAMAKFNAIEGIRQSSESMKMFAAFERSGASDEERRRAIVDRHTRKG